MPRIYSASAGSGGSSVDNLPYLQDFGATSFVYPAAQFGAKFDNSTDDTAAINNAIAAASQGLYSLSGNDKVGATVLLPPGRAKITTPINMKPNVVLKGHGPANTWITSSSFTGQQLIQLETGAEAQVEIRDLGLLPPTAVDGIGLYQTSILSALGDARHIIENVNVVGGRQAVVLDANTECRVLNCSFYLQQVPSTKAAFWVGGSDQWVENCTVAQVQNQGQNFGTTGSGIRDRKSVV